MGNGHWLTDVRLLNALQFWLIDIESIVLKRLDFCQPAGDKRPLLFGRRLYRFDEDV